jgi:two-component system chemotaxis response regulator CheB
MEENNIDNPCKVLLIGGSAGSLQVLFSLIPAIKPNFTFAVIIILHRRSSADSALSELLSTKTSAPTLEAEDKDPILPGRFYLAPADYHLLIEKNGTFSLDYSEKINFSRPSIDVTFESAAEIYGPSLVAMLLSGANEDGTKGLLTIKSMGGKTVAQNPETAQMPFMPQHAISHNAADYIQDLKEMADFINNLS